MTSPTRGNPQAPEAQQEGQVLQERRETTPELPPLPLHPQPQRSVWEDEEEAEVQAEAEEAEVQLLEEPVEMVGMEPQARMDLWSWSFTNDLLSHPK